MHSDWFIWTINLMGFFTFIFKSPKPGKKECLFDLIRHQTLKIYIKVGTISQYFDEHYNTSDDETKPHISHKDRLTLAKSFSGILSIVVFIAASMGYSLQENVKRKMELNKKKYITGRTKGADKVDQKAYSYADETGVTKNSGQTIFLATEYKPPPLIYPLPINNQKLLRIDNEAIFQESYKFAEEREWHVHDKPVNLTLALIGEIAELSELYTWKKEEAPCIDTDKIDKTLQELADITIYLLRLAHTCGIEPDSLK